MKISNVIEVLEDLAPPSLQESYDNAGLLTGKLNWSCTGVLCCLDVTEAVVQEAKQNNCNLIVAHHPIIFGGLKKLTGSNYVEATVIDAIKHDIAIYAIHTNLDNVQAGVNQTIAQKLQLTNLRILSPKKNILSKLFTFVPANFVEQVQEALFTAGAGHIGEYSECSFTASGNGTFKASENAQPFVGEIGKRHVEAEVKLEVVFESWKERQIIAALKASHPYEEVAYDVVALQNKLATFGSGLVGELTVPMTEVDFLQNLKQVFGLQVIKHTSLLDKPVQKIAVCGGAGSFLTKQAVAVGADFYITADVKYHEFFDAENKLILADIGHYESEQFTIELLVNVLQQNFPTFAVLKTRVNTNPVQYFV